MYDFLCKTLLRVRCISISRSIPTQTHDFLGNQSSLFLLSIRYISKTSNQTSFAVSYLINSFGFTPESALLASKHLRFGTPTKPDLVINCLKNHGFSQTQISNLISRRPELLSCSPDKTLVPKFEFFYSKGVSISELGRILNSNPWILRRSLVNHIIPCFNFLKNLLQSDEKTFVAIKRSSYFINKKNIETNVNLLRANGVPDSNVAMFLSNQPRTFISNSSKFKEIVEAVKEMGFNPLTTHFLVAVLAKSVMNKSVWQRKVDAYQRWGWSEEVILAAFGKFPWCMTLSVDKIMASMDFFVNKMGWEPLDMAKYPMLLSMSLEKRLIPRASVFHYLSSKGLIGENCHSFALFKDPEKTFLQKWVNCYEEAPELLKLYKEKLDLSR